MKKANLGKVILLLFCLLALGLNALVLTDIASIPFKKAPHEFVRISQGGKVCNPQDFEIFVHRSIGRSTLHEWAALTATVCIIALSGILLQQMLMSRRAMPPPDSPHPSRPNDP